MGLSSAGLVGVLFGMINQQQAIYLDFTRLDRDACLIIHIVH